MQKKLKHKIVIIGCGNLAWHLARRFSGLKNYELFIYNHKPNTLLNDFRTKLKCTTHSSLANIIPDADFYFICVTDKFVSQVAKKINLNKPISILIHTSGSLKINELGNKANTAVFYPVQTFSKQDEINWKETPIIIEAKNKIVQTKIAKLAKLFSENSINLDYKQRLKIHLAAVLVNNFTNALFVAAGDLIPKNSGNKFLLPLIKQTVLKIEHMDPLLAQTGPAKRNDSVVMKKHLKLLSQNEELKYIYKQLSELIVTQQTKKHA
ncbi:MAG: DUF2520 domain-containing protein [Bacteroidota bacterium]|nr:DUF2520 domain-containing protein [Bacteroidota bacterium]MDP3144149.1 DUF2520 domain-containing protein [Bacteroidota bacterium]